MIGWLLKLIGASDELATHVDQIQWGWTRPVWLWLMVPLVPVAIYIVSRHRQHLGHVARIPRGLLSTCRIGMLVLLVIVLGGPIARFDEKIQRKPIVAIVLDVSASMTLPAGPFQGRQLAEMAAASGMLGDSNPNLTQNPTAIDAETRRSINRITRLDLARKVLGAKGKLLTNALAKRFELRAYTVAGKVTEVKLEQILDESQPLPSAADATVLGAVIDRILDDTAGRRLAGVVLLSDGQSTRGPEPLEVLELRDAAGRGDQRVCPIWAVPIGSANPLADVALIDVLAPAQLAAKDSATVIAAFESHGLDGKTVSIRLMEGDRELQRIQVTLQSRRQQRVELSFTADEPGARMLTVQIDALPEEEVKQNNRLPLSIRVDRDKLRLLYLEGSPRWDFRFLDHALRRDRGLELTIVTEAQLVASGISGKDLPTAAGLPQDAEGFGQYHTVILGDISPELLPRRFAEQLVRAIEEKGVGLIVQAGMMHMPHGFSDSPLEKVLPIRMREDQGLPGEQSNGLTAPAFAPFQMKVTAAGAIHPAFRLYDSASKNRRLWSRMPVFYWAAAERARRGATVLAEFQTSDGDRPLIMERHAGRGRVMFIGLDSTFLWRRNIGSYLFYRFWGQAIRHVARRDDPQGNQNWLEIYPPRIEPGDTVALQLHAVNDEGDPIDAEREQVYVHWSDSMDVIDLKRGNQPGLFAATWRPPQAGRYHFSFTDTRGRALTATVQVAATGLEWLHPDVDRDALGRLAEASGGELIELDQLAQLPEKLQGGPVEVTRHVEHELWDNWLMLALLVGMYCLDVGTRRVLGLT